MVKNMEDSSVNIFIEDELDGKKQVIKSSLNIPYAVDGKDKSLRIFHVDNSNAFYASNRLGTLKATDSGYEADVTDEDNLIGKRFELTDVATRKVVLKGKVATKKSEAQIIDLPKMANAGK